MFVKGFDWISNYFLDLVRIIAGFLGDTCTRTGDSEGFYLNFILYFLFQSLGFGRIL